MVRIFKFTGIVEEVEWKPTDIGGCVLWLRSDLAWQDAAKTVPCVADSLIYVGEDKSLDNDVIQATEANRPIYKTNQINGHPAWRFDGVDDALLATYVLNQPFTRFLVMKQISWTNGDFIFSGPAVLGGMYQDTTTPNLSLHAGLNAPTTNALAVGVFGIVTCEFNGAASRILINGANPVTGNPGAINPGGISLGAYVGYIQQSNIDVAEVIDYDSILSTADRQRVESYLNAEAQGNGYAIY